MIDFSSWLDLPLIWGALIATAVFMYVTLDGFDLGCGILFPFAPDNPSRHIIINSIAPFWDGNETWLILGGGGLLVAFPLAYSIILPALYLPIILMLMGLIFRGVAFEFYYKANDKGQHLWSLAFHGGSLLSAFMQGIILGNFVQGFNVEGRSFAGGPLDWANGFSVVTGVAMIFAYALIGATWLVMKTEGKVQQWARRCARYVLAFVFVSMCTVSIAMPLIDATISTLWFSLPNFFYLLPIPLVSAITFLLLWRDLYQEEREVRPFLLSLGIFLLGYIGLCVSLYPWIVPFKFTLWQAAAVSTSQSIVLIGTVIMLPIILVYTAYCYYVFRGKSRHNPYY